MDEIKIISEKFFPNRKPGNIQIITGGLIHKTFIISFDRGETYILQALNHSVFKDLPGIMDNIQCIAAYLKKNNYPLAILQPINSRNGLLEKDRFGNYWRAFPFFENTTVLNKVENPKQAFEAAKAFGLFLKHLHGIDLKKINVTIPNFHNLKNRIDLFNRELQKAPNYRREKAKKEIKIVLMRSTQLKFDFQKMPLRVVHNDTKISNVLLDKKGEKGVCVIDLDTVMPGYLVTDFGDMIRTMCCTASEEEINLEKVEIDIEIFKAAAEGFLTPLKTNLTKEEKKNLVAGGAYIIFEQALRFLTDYLQGDIYYPVQHVDQNLFRAKNQLKLLKSILDKKKELELIVKGLC